MPFAEHNHMIEAVPPDRTDQPLRVSILPGRPRRTRSIPDAHCLKAPDEDFAHRTVSITDRDIAVPRSSHRLQSADGQSIRRSDARSRLATEAFCANVAGSQVHTIVETKNRRDDEHVNRRDGIGMIAKKRLPAL